MAKTDKKLLKIESKILNELAKISVKKQKKIEKLQQMQAFLAELSAALKYMEAKVAAEEVKSVEAADVEDAEEVKSEVKTEGAVVKVARRRRTPAATKSDEPIPLKKPASRSLTVRKTTAVTTRVAKKPAVRKTKTA